MSPTDVQAKRAFDVSLADYAADLEALRAVRETVFVQEQQVPMALEWDAQDPHCIHVLARDAAGQAIGTGRLVPPGSDLPPGDHVSHGSAERTARIGRMAVVSAWRRQGVGDAILHALLDEARSRHWPYLCLHAQVSAIGFYERNGFIPEGARFIEAGIEHQTMRRHLGGPVIVDSLAAARAAVIGIVQHARRELIVHSRQLDPDLFDDAGVMAAMRALATRRQRTEVRILLHDATQPQRAHASLITLAQRLPSVFAFRETSDPVDRNDPSACVVNDDGGYYYRPLAHRYDGETSLDAGGRSRQLMDSFQHVWERARPCSELRALGL